MTEFPTVYTVLENLSDLIDESDENYKEYGKRDKIYIDDVYKKLSIFDWFKDTLSQKDLKNMFDFCTLAIRLHFDGYICFKVGASGCANGMWAHKEKSTTGYSPDCDFIFRSFTPDETYYAIHESSEYYPEKYNAWNKKDLINYVKNEYKGV